MITQEVSKMGIREFFSRFRLVAKRSSRLTKLVILGAVIISLTALLVLHSLTLKAQNEGELWRNQAQQLEQENQKLEDKIKNLGSLEGIKDIAQEILGMVFPDTVIIRPEK